MAIDTSMYGQIKPIQIDGPLDMAAKAAQFKQMQSQNRLADLMFAEKDRASQEQNALRGLLSDQSNYDERGNLARSVLPKIGAAAPGQYGDYQKHIATQEKTALEAKKAQLEESLKRFEVSGQIMAGVKDQATWTLARQQAAQLFGPEAAAQMPEVYDPALVEQKRMQAMTVQQQMEQQWKALNFQLDKDKFGYQQTNDAANRNVTLRGQNLVDARGREANQIKQQEVAMGGKPPPGYRWAPDGQSLVAIPGGPGDKLPEAQQKQVVGVNNLRNAIAEYRAALSGFGALDKLNPNERAKMGTKYNNMMLQAKEAYNLGVLNGPDYDILQSVITDPRSFQAAIISKDALDTQAAELDRMMGGVAQTSSQVRAKPGAPSVAQTAKPSASIPQGAIDMLKSNPALRAQFDAKYGQGAAASVLGK